MCVLTQLKVKVIFTTFLTKNAGSTLRENQVNQDIKGTPTFF